jgi:hypothetical protein
MAAQLSSPTSPLTIDLTGLPEPVALGMRQLVDALREEHAGASSSDASPPDVCPEPQVASFISRPRPTAEEIERLLDELASGPPGKVLPPDFSRADIYDDHD